MEKMSEFYEKFEDKRYIGIRYEDLVLDTQETVKKVCNTAVIKTLITELKVALQILGFLKISL